MTFTGITIWRRRKHSQKVKRMKRESMKRKRKNMMAREWRKLEKEVARENRKERKEGGREGWERGEGKERREWRERGREGGKDGREGRERKEGNEGREGEGRGVGRRMAYPTDGVGLAAHLHREVANLGPSQHDDDANGDKEEGRKLRENGVRCRDLIERSIEHQGEVDNAI